MLSFSIFSWSIVNKVVSNVSKTFIYQLEKNLLNYISTHLWKHITQPFFVLNVLSISFYRISSIKISLSLYKLLRDGVKNFCIKASFILYGVFIAYLGWFQKYSSSWKSKIYFFIFFFSTFLLSPTNSNLFLEVEVKPLHHSLYTFTRHYSSKHLNTIRAPSS